MRKLTRVVIVGAGFAGVKAARELSRDNRFQVTLLSDRTCFEYHAALYRSATGWSPLEVEVSLAEIFRKARNVTVYSDAAVSIDEKKRIVTTRSGRAHEYDELILALGTVTDFFGIKGLPQYSYTIKTMAQALRLKRHLHNELIGRNKPDLNYVVVGAGPSGVELAAELVSYLNQVRRRHNSKKPFRVGLIEAAPRILPNLPEGFSRRVEKRLRQLGVKIYTSTAVKGETANSLQLPEGGILTHTVIWTAGMANNPLFDRHAKLFNFGKNGRVNVNARLGTGSHIWVVGDSAQTPQAGWAQTATYDGNFVARNLQRKLSGQTLLTYSPSQPIGAIPVGPNWCGINYRGWQIYGYAGWLVRRWFDLRLYATVLPKKLAFKTWLAGHQMVEECPECRSEAP